MICQFEIMFLVKYSRYAAFYVVILVGNYIFNSRTRDDIDISEEVRA